MSEQYYEKPEYLEAQKNWREKGSLGVTASDYEAISGTPEDELIQNPGKTLGEIWSDEQILDHLIGTERNIEENESIEKMKKWNDDLKENLRVTILYLKSINRLPKEYIEKTTELFSSFLFDKMISVIYTISNLLILI
jgi:hypothetical protein